MTEEEIVSEIEEHNGRNAVLLDQFRQLGHAPDEVHPIEFHFWAANKEDAAGLAARLREEGYETLSISAAESESSLWSATVMKRTSLGEAASQATSSELVRIAAERAAEYDGWGASV